MRAVIANEVALGEPLTWSIYDPAGKLLFVQGMVIASQAQLDIVLERGRVIPESATSGGVMLPAMRSTPMARGIPTPNPNAHWNRHATPSRRCSGGCSNCDAT